MHRIKVLEVSVCYPQAEQHSLCEVSCTVEPGRITLLLGRSGSGKTTLLKAMLGLIGIDKGRVERYKTPGLVGYVPQGCDLFPHLNVLHNCVQPQRIVLRRSKREAEEIAQSCLARLGIATLAGRFPAELSGGQRQKAALARALAAGAKLLLLDEPSSALDPTSTEELVQLLLGLKAEGIGTLISTHDLPLARDLLDRAYLLHEGRVVAFQDGEADPTITTYLQGGAQ